MFLLRTIPAFLLTLLPLCAKAEKRSNEDQKPSALPYEVGDYVEQDFPFFSSVLDARDSGPASPRDNLTPRGLILNLGHDLWACFDVDLLRIACIWQGEAGKPPVTQVALAARSYHNPGQKTKDGEEDVPRPIGKIWAANGIYPGWQTGTGISLSDPRPPGPDPEEIGRGPLPPALGSFQSLAITKTGVILRMTVGSTPIVQRLKAIPQGESWLVEITSVVNPHPAELTLLLGTERLRFPAAKAPEAKVLLVSPEKVEQPAQQATQPTAPRTPWTQTVSTSGHLSPNTDAAYVLDTVSLPVTNPWKRNVRLADIAFLDDKGNAAAIAMDGDVWLISGLIGEMKSVIWRRFTSGLHEPMSIVAKGTDLLVYDRNGIWKLIDTDKDGSCDVHEMFCHLFSQTAETREFPSSMKLGPGGVLYIAKGGQQGTHLGKDNGSVIRIAADGKSIQTIAHGLRQPFIGVDEITGLVTCSDQQGNYVPSTPLHILRDNQYYGHLATIQPKEKYPGPIADPLTWIPHPVNPSGLTQVWLHNAKLGPLNGQLIHLAYSRPEIFRVMFDPSQKTKPQAAVCQIPFPEGLAFPPLNGHVNPADGSLFLVGFQIWGSTAKDISGLARMRYTGKSSPLPDSVVATDKGILLHFDAPLANTPATNPDNYSIGRWNYKRTWDYGSAHYKLDGSTGQEILTASAAYLSRDSRTVFVAIPDMRPCDQMHIGWSLKSAVARPVENNAYFTPWNLAPFEPKEHGLGDIQINLTPRTPSAVAAVKPSVEEGQRLYQFIGCMGCHSVDGSVAGRLGPSWQGLYGSTRNISDGTKVKADEAYIRESILDPSKKKVKDYLKLESGMPIYAGILSDSQIESIILYMKALPAPPKTK